MVDGEIRLGILAWPQYTAWDDLERVGARADSLGYDALWTWDHLYPIVGSHEGPIFEGWMTLAFVELGFRHIVFDFTAPWDAETLERLTGEVKPLLAERTAAATTR